VFCACDLPTEFAAQALADIRFIFVFEQVQRLLHRTFSAEIIHRRAGVQRQSAPEPVGKFIFLVEQMIRCFQSESAPDAEAGVSGRQLAVTADTQEGIEQVHEAVPDVEDGRSGHAESVFVVPGFLRRSLRVCQKYSVAPGGRLCGTYLYKPNARSGASARREKRPLDRVGIKNRQNIGKQRFKWCAVLRADWVRR